MHTDENDAAQTLNVNDEIPPTGKKLKVYKKDDNGEALRGAKFSLYKEDGTFLMSRTTDSDGEIEFNGLEKGNYYL